MSGGWVSALEPAHATRGRVRWRYACRPGAPSDPHALERAVATVDGVRKVRINAPRTRWWSSSTLRKPPRAHRPTSCMVPAQARRRVRATATQRRRSR